MGLINFSRNLSLIQTDFHPFFGNLFEMVIVKSSGDTIRDSDPGFPPKKSSDPEFIDGGLIGNRSYDFGFVRFLAEKIRVDGGSFSIQSPSTVPTQLPIRDAEVPRSVTVTFRETRDLQVYRLFRRVFTQMYNPNTGVYSTDSDNYLYNGFLLIRSTFQRQGRVVTAPVLLLGFSRLIPTYLPSLSLAWAKDDVVKYDIPFAFSTFDALPLIVSEPGRNISGGLNSLLEEIQNNPNMSIEDILFSQMSWSADRTTTYVVTWWRWNDTKKEHEAQVTEVTRTQSKSGRMSLISIFNQYRVFLRSYRHYRNKSYITLPQIKEASNTSAQINEEVNKHDAEFSTYKWEAW